jgi:SAM-dependent methyltransferase
MAAQIAAARGAKVTGFDASEALLAIARERTPNAEFHQGELEKLPFADGAFDVVTGFNSFQFAANPVAALSEARRVTRKGGTVVVFTWGKPEGMPAATLVAAMKPLMPPPPPGVTPPGPFALSDETALRKLAQDAGLTPGEVFDVEMTWEYGDLATAVRAVNSSGVAARAMAHSGEEAVTKAHEAALLPFRGSDGRIRVGARFRGLMTQS